jgi:hypothetical protein
VTAASGASGRSGPGLWIGILAAVVAVVALVVLTGRQPSGDPFDVRSPAPDGYKALALLLRDRGARVERSTAERARREPPAAGQVLVVPDPGLLTQQEASTFRTAARDGALVVLGAPRTEDGSGGDDPLADLGGGTFSVGGRELADTPADPVRPGRCDIASLADLGPVDSAFTDPVPVRGAGSSCYGDSLQARVLRQEVGRGAVVTLGSPYLWANARLQPDKEDGGEPLGNAVMALRLLGPTSAGATSGTRITFLDAVPSAGVTPEGGRNPIELLPLGVRLALVQLVAAFVLYAWWRARRLGRPVRERVPVAIAGSELVAAVGDLLRRRGSPDRAAAVLRSEARRQLARRLGVPPDAPPVALAAVVADRTGRDRDAVAAALLDGPVGTAEELVRLTNSIDAIRQEVLHGHPVA